MRVLILGAGGLGSVLGGYLANIGVDVTLVGRPAHTEAITRYGLRITGRRGDLVITDNLTAVDQTAKATGAFRLPGVGGEGQRYRAGPGGGRRVA